MEKLMLDMHKDVGHIKEQLVAQGADLKEHMKRSTLLETEVSLLRQLVYVAYGIVVATAVFLKFFAR